MLITNEKQTLTGCSYE